MGGYFSDVKEVELTFSKEVEDIGKIDGDSVGILEIIGVGL